MTMDDNKKKHLEFIQLVITRMNMNSFLLKGWAVTLVAALFAFAAKDMDIRYLVITFISTSIFWFLDGYYLNQERQYRGLYNHVRQLTNEQIDFNMDASLYNRDQNRWIPSVFSITLTLFYGALMGITLVVRFIIN